uniref:G-protein coupled receptors family 1 profile domain-containing protein n=1 Tax=Caenorhabditis japonica TaxID=281687 RepID=A0A8R1DDW6_CAEJA
MTATTMKFREFVYDTQYHYLFRFWYRNFVTVFAPFFILLYLNIRIVKALTTYSTATVCLVTNGNSEDLQKRKASARAATRTLVMVGCCYMISNIINVILTSIEQANKDMAVEYPDIYIVAIDLVSLLTTMACAARLPIYLYCQPILRREIFMRFKRLCIPWSSSSPEKLGERLKSVETDTSFLSKAENNNNNYADLVPIATISEVENEKIPEKISTHSPYETLL